MSMVNAGSLVTNASTLLIKHGRGSSVGLWKDSKNRYGYYKFPSDHELVIEYTGAECKYLEVGNCATVFGSIDNLIVGNSLMCEGRIRNLAVGNDFRLCNLKVQTRDEDLISKYNVYLDGLADMQDIATDAEIARLKEQALAKTKRRKAIIKLHGQLDKLVIQEPTGIPVEVLVRGHIQTLKIGNCLSCKGDINKARVNNFVYAAAIDKVQAKVERRIS